MNLEDRKRNKFFVFSLLLIIAPLIGDNTDQKHKNKCLQFIHVLDGCYNIRQKRIVI